MDIRKSFNNIPTKILITKENNKHIDKVRQHTSPLLNQMSKKGISSSMTPLNIFEVLTQ